MVNHQSTQQLTRRARSARPILRRVATDVLPTLFLLSLMALGMSLVARYAESSHFTPVSANNYVFHQFAD